MLNLEFNDRPEGVWAEENLPRTITLEIPVELTYCRGLKKGFMSLRYAGATVHESDVPEGQEPAKLGEICPTLGAGLHVTIDRLGAAYSMTASDVWEAIARALDDVPDPPAQEGADNA